MQYCQLLFKDSCPQKRVSEVFRVYRKMDEEFPAPNVPQTPGTYSMGIRQREKV